jgi:hypothetical protein
MDANEFAAKMTREAATAAKTGTTILKSALEVELNDRYGVVTVTGWAARWDDLPSHQQMRAFALQHGYLGRPVQVSRGGGAHGANGFTVQRNYVQYKR